MTEEIIIDGVDVARCCKCYKIEQKILCGVSGICANNPNCYYKQLKRLEQENKQMKSALEEIKDLCIHYKNTNDKCVTNCYAHFIVTDLIQDKINEVLGND